ncbi:MAG: peptidase M61 [Cryomorphaceae bacterium]|nr:MAG: peptidase M61 [Cryomorphaceae bacterium]
MVTKNDICHEHTNYLASKFNVVMRKLILTLLVASVAFYGNAQNAVSVKTDITQLQDGMLAITVAPGHHGMDTLIYAMPKIVPGTYSIYDFGNMLRQVKAYDLHGDTLAVVRLDENRWMIPKGNKLSHLSYLAAPTFTDPAGKKVFEPAGTRFELDRTFLFNSFAMVGYFEGLKDENYAFEVVRPADFYGASALERKALNDTTDLFTAQGYFDFHDSPIMYARPDTASFMVGETEVQVAIYSPGGSLDAAFVSEKLEPIMFGAKEYLGGALPVPKYVVLISLMQGMGNSGGFGALEHFYSTVFVMPEMGRDYLSKTIQDVVAHEFFHIVTPLNIHSEHIHDYDFNNPQMSRHLWLYEGVTEYTSHHMQVKQGLIDPDEFLSTIRSKISQASGFNDTLPFTELSLGALDVHKNQYMNVYMKGALIGMCLDLLLCDLSDGAYGLPELMMRLSERYGPDRHFWDEELFDVIAEMTFPEVREFFRRYVEGPEPLPLEEYLLKAGVQLQRNLQIRELTLGGFLPGKNKERNRMEIVTSIGINSFGRELGVQKGDMLVSINAIDLSPENFSDGVELFKQRYKEGDNVTLVVERENEKGQLKTHKLKAKAQGVDRTVSLRIRYMPEPDERQRLVRKRWINY